MQLSKLESKAYNLLRGNELFVFGIKDISLMLGLSKTQAYNLIKSLKRKEVIDCFKGGVYSFKDVSEFVTGSRLNWLSYLSFWSALNYYGFSDQMPKKIFFASTKYSKEVNGFKYITISKNRFFGYIHIKDVVIADKEKAIIDSLLFPKYAGGIREVKKCLGVAIKELNIDKLIEYAIKVNSKIVVRRLGFLLEELNVTKKSNLIQLSKYIGKGYEKFDSSMKSGSNLNKKWLLDINVK